jgi:PAS domain S-box-containing protein
MGWFRDKPIRQKLLFAILVPAGAALLLVGTAILYWDRVLVQEELQQDMSSVAEIIAENSAGAVAFEDPESASRTLEALRAKSHVVSACIYRGDGTVLARYDRGIAAACPQPSIADGEVLGERGLEISRAIDVDQRRIGTLTLLYDLGEVRERMLRDAAALAVVLVIAILLAVFLSGKLRGAITEPILSLADTAKAVSRTKNYSLRAERLSDDELGVLVDGFNDMLANVKQRDLELRTSEERFRTMADSSPVPIWIDDPQGGVEFVNRAYGELFGITLQQVRDTGWQPLIHPDDLAEYSRVFFKALRERAPFHAQARIRCADGEWHWIASYGAPLLSGDGAFLGMVGTSPDITPIKLAQEEREQMVQILEQRVRERTEQLRHSEDRFRLLVEGVQEYAIFMLDTEGRVTTWNVGAERLKGYRVEEILGQSFSAFYPLEARDKPARLLRTAAERGRVEDEGWRVRRDGTRFWANVIITALHDSSGKLVGFSKIVRDLTARKEAEEAIRAQAVELARSNADLQQFAYVASHDLQEPLRMVTSYMQIIADQFEGKLGADADECIGFAVEGAQRMRQLITGLLAYSRIGTGGQQPAHTDSSAVLEEARANLEMAIREAGATITSDPLPSVMADASQMLQLFQNLVANAVTFHGKTPPEVHVSAKRNGSGWVFSVADNGIGIAPEHYERIFVIFQRLHDRLEYKGTGIGLAICKKIVERWGGKIWVESQRGSGSTFYFTIPDSPAESKSKVI